MGAALEQSDESLSLTSYDRPIGLLGLINSRKSCNEFSNRNHPFTLSHHFQAKGSVTATSEALFDRYAYGGPFRSSFKRVPNTDAPMNNIQRQVDLPQHTYYHHSACAHLRHPWHSPKLQLWVS